MVTTSQTMLNTPTFPRQFAALLRRGTQHVSVSVTRARISTKYLYGRKYAAYNK